jgi:hypothetical protein
VEPSPQIGVFVTHFGIKIILQFGCKDATTQVIKYQLSMSALPIGCQQVTFKTTFPANDQSSPDML